MPSRRRPGAEVLSARSVLWAACLLATGGTARGDNLALTTPGLPRTGAYVLPPTLLTQDDASRPHHDHSPDDTEDLTRLSLEELLDLNVTTINVLGSHTHLKGQTMVGYRFMAMTMDGYLDGTDEASNSQVLRRFPTIHTRMEMSEHMLELMHAFSDDFTVMAMVPYKHGVMHHMKADGTRFTVRSSGLGDVNLMGMYNVLGDPRALPRRPPRREPAGWAPLESGWGREPTRTIDPGARFRAPAARSVRFPPGRRAGR